MTVTNRQERDLGLPLMDDRDSTLWSGIEATELDRHALPANADHVWPMLTDALSESGRKRLWTALHEAVNETPDDPERALMVVEAFWRTMLLRRGPHYARRVQSRLDARTDR
jgi:hypothetical protein